MGAQVYYGKAGLIIGALLLLLTPEARAQQEAYESPAGTKFLLYKPPGYSSTTSTYPLLLSLHSKGEVADDLSELTSKNPEQMPCRLIYQNAWPQDLPFIVLTPQLKPDPGDPEIQWSAAYIDEVVNYVTRNFRVDLTRIYVTGISRGGTGAWTYASAFPGKVAALLPMSGRSDLAQACPLKDIPVWAFHGDGDGIAPPAYSIDMVNAIKACQPSGKFTPRLNILHAKNHDGWNEVYNGSAGYRVYNWLLMFRKGDTSNKKPYVNAGRDLRIRLRKEPLHIMGDFFDADGRIANVAWKQTRGTALTLQDAGSGFLKISGLITGSFEFELTVTDDKGGQSKDTMSLEITDTAVTPSITRLILFDGRTDAELGDLFEGRIIDKTKLNLGEINIGAVASEGTASVRFSINTDQHTRTQNGGPYLVKNRTAYPEWKITAGTYWICATPYTQTSARGNTGVSQCYRITFTDGPMPPACENTGTIRQELWTGVSGTTILSIPVARTPTSVTDLAALEGPSNIGDNYGRRIRGYICPPASGSYVFWIASNDNSELWLSTDDQPANSRKIASVSGYTNAQQWDKYPAQKSAGIALVANQKYYIEALHKEGVGTDHVAVGWQLPGGSLERPIPGMRLIPFTAPPPAATPSVSITNPVNGQSFTAPASVNITATASVSGGTIARVEFYSGTTKLGTDTASPYSYSWTGVPAGSYRVTAKAVDNAGGSASASITITVGSAPCAGTGTILRELWKGIQNNDVASIPLNSAPAGVSELAIFEEPSNAGDNYGTRVSGYLCAPATGVYTFWISSNDNSELWLSTDANPSNRKRIAWVSGYTNVREWTRYSSQRSAAITLTAGRRYYVEALHKEGIGSDHMAVGWQLPNGTLERPIPGHRLSPFESTASASLSGGSPDQSESEARDIILTESGTDVNGTALEIYPNPFPGGGHDLTLSGFEGGNEGREVRVEIMPMTGGVIHSQTIICETPCRVVVVNIRQELPCGLYFVAVVRGGKRVTRRLLVR